MDDQFSIGGKLDRFDALVISTKRYMPWQVIFIYISICANYVA